MENDDTLDGVVKFILTAIERTFADVNTSNKAKITAISEDKTLIDVIIDTTKQEVPEITCITMGGWC